MARPDPFEDMPPQVKARLMKPHTVFAPGTRIKFNIVPMFLNLFLPWSLFTLCSGLSSGWLMYTEPGFVMVISSLIILLGLASLYQAVKARRLDPEPTWWSYTALSITVASVAGLICGSVNYVTLAKPFFEIMDLKAVHQVDARYERGQNMMDAGILYFAKGNKLDAQRSWHFMHHTQYCVAPIAASGKEPATHAYDFWAVGEDCCSMSSSDFRCGEWSNSAARSGIRVLDDPALPFYRLAVQQAETLYGIQAAHPIFVRWSQDPLAEVNSWNAKAFRNYLFMVCFSFVVALLFVVLASSKYAFLGRAESVYGTDFLDDEHANWKKEGYSKPNYSSTRASHPDA